MGWRAVTLLRLGTLPPSVMHASQEELHLHVLLDVRTIFVLHMMKTLLRFMIHNPLFSNYLYFSSLSSSVHLHYHIGTFQVVSILQPILVVLCIKVQAPHSFHNSVLYYPTSTPMLAFLPSLGFNHRTYLSSLPPSFIPPRTGTSTAPPSCHPYAPERLGPGLCYRFTIVHRPLHSASLVSR